jgi:hypothetical protein
MNEATMIEILSQGARLGVHGEAVPDLLHRAASHFGDSAPDTATLRTWAEDLAKGDGPHLFAPPRAAAAAVDVSFLSGVAERLTRGRPADEAPGSGGIEYRGEQCVGRDGPSGTAFSLSRAPRPRRGVEEEGRRRPRRDRGPAGG